MKTRWQVVVLLFIFSCAQGAEPDASWTRKREATVRAVTADVARHADVLPQGRLSPAVAAALREVPRHLFVPRLLQARAYDNNALPIGHGQTISQPSIVAMMTELLAVAPGDTVLEVGTGSGYQAAVLGAMGVVVHSIEIVPELAADAAALLDELGYDTITVHCGDGYAGLPDLAPFDAIIVTAAPPELPQALVRQLKEGGRLVIPLGRQDQAQWLTVWTREADGRLDRRSIIPVRFVPMVSGPGDGNP